MAVEGEGQAGVELAEGRLSDLIEIIKNEKY